MIHNDAHNEAYWSACKSISTWDTQLIVHKSKYLFQRSLTKTSQSVAQNVFQKLRPSPQFFVIICKNDVFRWQRGGYVINWRRSRGVNGCRRQTPQRLWLYIVSQHWLHPLMPMCVQRLIAIVIIRQSLIKYFTADVPIKEIQLLLLQARLRKTDEKRRRTGRFIRRLRSDNSLRMWLPWLNVETFGELWRAPETTVKDASSDRTMTGRRKKKRLDP